MQLKESIQITTSQRICLETRKEAFSQDIHKTFIQVCKDINDWYEKQRNIQEKHRRIKTKYFRESQEVCFSLLERKT